MQHGPVDVMIQKVVHLIFDSSLDRTIQTKLVEAVLAEGLTKTILSQIKAYCVEELGRIDGELAKLDGFAKEE